VQDQRKNVTATLQHSVVLASKSKNNYGNFSKKILTPYAPSFSVSTELYNHHSTLCQVSQSHLRLQILLDPHIKILGAKCLIALNILKYLSHPRTGCSRKLLLQLYNGLIRSQLDYGAPIYSHANKSSLKLLDSIQSSSLRLALDTLRTSPTLSLCPEAGIPSLRYRFLSLTANFLASTDQYPNLPF